VDLKYLFEHSMDTSHYNQKNKIDTIQKWSKIYYW
jgi:hypothetical protein